MNSTTFDFYPQKILNSSSYNELMPNSISSFPQNLDYFQGMLPYMNYQLMDNYNEQFPIYNPYFNKKNVAENTNQTESPIKSTTNEDSKDKDKNETAPKKENKEKNNYINLLINSVNNLFSKGEISQEYLNSETRPKFDQKKFSLTLNNLTENSENTFSKKCDNKVCTYLADDPHKLFQAKFFLSNSYKPKNVWLCEKCYKAYSLENYCYYCHVIYREYEHGTQYYDRKKWIQCDYCFKWHHMQCEEKKGKYENIEELSMNNNFKYMCPFCRKEHESIMRQKHKNEKLKKKNFLNIKKKRPLNESKEFNKINKK